MLASDKSVTKMKKEQAFLVNLKESANKEKSNEALSSNHRQENKNSAHLIKLKRKVKSGG